MILIERNVSIRNLERNKGLRWEMTKRVIDFNWRIVNKYNEVINYGRIARKMNYCCLT